MKAEDIKVSPEMQEVLEALMNEGILQPLQNGNLIFNNQIYQPIDMKTECIKMPIVDCEEQELDESKIEKTVTIVPLINGKVRLNLRGSWFEKDVENGHRDLDRTFDYEPTDSKWDLLKTQIKQWLKSHLGE